MIADIFITTSLIPDATLLTCFSKKKRLPVNQHEIFIFKIMAAQKQTLVQQGTLNNNWHYDVKYLISGVE